MCIFDPILKIIWVLTTTKIQLKSSIERSVKFIRINPITISCMIVILLLLSVVQFPCPFLLKVHKMKFY